ncbi:2-hydroxyisoflavanone dehydratase-like [Impatiens glandulifera]|uniref:2-hydroxyisoflavanone dehydratase-like n=1 Tax=Impatiens glandulifera TaxID=253017 RepID=UPI001FB0F74A|nr:2-hydroxyisoflavanone dehydratase-like [Impatiens glandulifera]
MDSVSGEYVHDFPPFIRVHKNGEIERLFVAGDDIPAGFDPVSGVETIDVLVIPETNVKARIFIPKSDDPDAKFPLIVHYHGGGFCIGSPYSPFANNFLTSFASYAQTLIVSIDYRLAPEHPLPIAFDDSWAALQWIASHSNGQGPEPVLNTKVNFNRVFLAGESAGANIAHNMAVRIGTSGLPGLVPIGAIILHPYFPNQEPDKLIEFLYPGSNCLEDNPILSPKSDPNLKKMACKKVLITVASEDYLKPRGISYFETLKHVDWDGAVELKEDEGGDHCFFAFEQVSEKFKLFMENMATFIKQE